MVLCGFTGLNCQEFLRRLLGLTPAAPSWHRAGRLSARLRLVPVLPNTSPESPTWLAWQFAGETSVCLQGGLAGCPEVAEPQCRAKESCQAPRSVQEHWPWPQELGPSGS